MRTAYIKKVIKILEDSKVNWLELTRYHRFYWYLRVGKNKNNNSNNAPKQTISETILEEVKADKEIEEQSKIEVKEAKEKNLEYFVCSSEIGSFRFPDYELKPGYILDKGIVFGYSHSTGHDTELKLDYVLRNREKISDFGKVELLEILVREGEKIDFGKKLLRVRVLE